MRFFRLLSKDEKGATAIEYGLIAALIAVAAMTAMSQLGTQLGATVNQAKDCMKAGASC
jgi:pilus assembly protein Flp/PilA